MNNFNLFKSLGLTVLFAISLATINAQIIDDCITCPADQILDNDPGVCGAVVTFEDPVLDEINCDLVYLPLPQNFVFTGSVQNFVIPDNVTDITISALGAGGGNGNQGLGLAGIGGLGAEAYGEFSVTPGEVLTVVVGGRGADGGLGFAGGGGGGSFVYTGAPAGAGLLVAAGGGGGGADFGPDGCDGQATLIGTNKGIDCGSPMGSAGSGGSGGDSNGGGGGAGWLTTGNDAASGTSGRGGNQWAGGLAGIPGMGGVGGYGGGGGADEGGGAGGGYSGGDGGNGNGQEDQGNGGGGGSFVAGSASNPLTIAGVNALNGLVVITYVAPNLTQTTGLPSGSVFPIGTTTNTFVTTDVNGFEGTCTFDVTVNDVELPVLTCQGDVTINTDNLGSAGDCDGQYSWPHPLPTDNCNIEIYEVVYTNPDGSIDGPYDAILYENGAIVSNGNRQFGLGVSTVTYYVFDEHGNSVSCDFTVTVNDNEAPEFTYCPSDFTISNSVDLCGGDVNWVGPFGEDNCGDVTITRTDLGPAQGTVWPVGNYTVIYTIEDTNGNLGPNCEFDITVTDNQDPVVSCPSNTVQANTDLGLCSWVSDFQVAPSFNTDNCPFTLTHEISGATTVPAGTAGSAEGTELNLGVSTICYTITEDGGGMQVSQCCFDVNVVDNENPVITCPDNIAVNNDPGVCGAIVVFEDPVVSDNCPIAGGNMVSFAYSGAIENWVVPAGVTNITVTALGAQGATANLCGNLGGFGASITGNFAVTPGQSLNILVGEEGETDPDAGDGGGGGGGSFVWDSNTNALLIAAGGGGGASGCAGTGSSGAPGSADANTTTSSSGSAPGGINGNGGIGGNSGQLGSGGGGAGWLSNGTNGSIGDAGFGGMAILAGGAGGLQSASDQFGRGGFGGGGGHGGNDGTGGGGGGYNGGGGGFGFISPAGWGAGGGGGSFNSGSSILSLAGVNPGNGSVIISFESSLIQIAGLPSGSEFPVGTTTNTYIVTDGAGNTASCSFEVVVTDTEDPIISCPMDVAITTSNLGTTGDCEGQYGWTHPISTDNCGVVYYSVTYTNPDGTVEGPVNTFQGSSTTNLLDANRNFGLGTSTVTYYVEDASGNSNTCSFTVTVTDDEAPEFTYCPSDFTVSNSVDLCGGDVNWVGPFGSDNCGTVTITRTDFNPAQGTVWPVGTYTISYSIEDEAGLFGAVCEFDVTVTDNQNPEVACPSNTVQANTDDGTCSWVSDFQVAPSINTDNCPFTLTHEISGATVVPAGTLGSAEGTVFELGVSTVCYTVTEDANGMLVSSCCFDVNVVDDEDPVIICPADISLVNDEGECGAVVTYADPVVTDNCALPMVFLEQTAGLASGSLFPVGTTVNTFMATDAAGNTSECSFTVTIIDTESPDFTCPGDVTINSSSDGVGDCSAQEFVGFAGGASDNCAITLGIIGVTYPDGSYEELSSTTQEILLQNSIMDFPLGTSVVQYFLWDEAGNIFTCSQDITVIDDEAPEFTYCPNDFIVSNSVDLCGGPVNWADPIGADNCGGYTISGPTIVPDNGQVQGEIWDVGLYTITYTIVDDAGNSGSDCVFTVEVTDSQNPELLCPSNIVQADTDDGLCSWLSDAQVAPSVSTDNCPFTLTHEITGATVVPAGTLGSAEGTVFELGVSTVCYTITEDANGMLVSSCCFDVNVVDDEDPVIICPADISLVNDEGECGAVVTYADPVVTDNCALPMVFLEQTAGLASGSLFPVGTTVNTFMATDAAGNTSECSFTVTIIDTESPVVTCPGNFDIVTSDGGTGDCEGLLTWPLTLPTDNCDVISFLVTYNNPDGTIETFEFNEYVNPTFSRNFELGVTTVNYFAADSAGNTDACSFTVTVTDDEDPEFLNCPPNGTVVDVFTNDCVTGITWNIPVATDNCLGLTVVQTGGPDYGSEVPPGLYTITYLATDGAGNTDICTFDIQVIDTESPIINNCPFEDLILEVNNDCEGILPDYTTRVHATDNCGPYEVTQVPMPGTVYQVGDEVTVTVTVTDPSGNSSACVFDVLVQDNTLPTAICADMNSGNSIAFFDFETGMQGWTTGNDEFTVLGEPSVPSTWTLSLETGGCEPVTLGTTWFGTPNIGELELDCEGGDQGEGISLPAAERSWILSPVFNVGDNMVSINFDSYSANESGYPESYDVEHVQISINGSPFTDMHGYDPNLHTYSDNTIRNITYMAMVTPGDVVQFRFLYDTGDACCGEYNVTGWFLDNILISGLAGNDLYVYLDENGQASISVEDIDGGSYDNCGIESIVLSNYDFNCDYIGANTVVMTVTDNNGNTASCQSEVIVVDTLAPVAICNNLELELNAAGNAIISIADIDGGSYDNCEIVNIEISQTFFDCTYIGDNIVLLEVYDASGNVGTCEAIVTILPLDNDIFLVCPPTQVVDAPAGWCSAYVNYPIPFADAECENITIEQVDDSGLSSGDLFPVGKTQQIFVAFGANGPVDTCIINIFVNDYHTPPVIACPDNVSANNDPFECGASINNIGLTVLEDNCPNNVAVTYEVTDASGNVLWCGIEDASGDEFPVGTSTVTYTAQDQPILLITEVDQSGSASSIVFINEFHYDNSGTDTGEFIEIAGGAGTDLTGYSLVLYNGSNGTTYNTIDLSGVIADQSNGLGAISFDLPSNGLQNGSPDGFALIAPNSQVLYFLSYEGSFEATNGPAEGMTSTDVGVSETSGTAIGESLQLMGTGSDYPDFSWGGPTIATPGDINAEQFVNEGSGNSIVDLVEITNFGPASMDIACLLVSREGASAQTHMVEGTTILQPGDTYVAEFDPSVSYNTPAAYTIGIEDAIFDVVALNGYSVDGFDGELIPTVSYSSWSRISVCDHDNADDWEEDYCGGSMGFLNPGLPVFPDNNWLTSLQSEVASEAICSFTVSIVDEESPACYEYEYDSFAGGAADIGSEACAESSVSVNIGAATMYAVQIENLNISFPDMGALTVELISPEGTSLVLFDGVCEGTADANISLSDTSSNIAGAPCGPFGGGNWYSPGNKAFKTAFFNENPNGTWTIKVTNYDGELSGVLNGYTLFIQSIVPYSQTDVTLENDPGICAANYEWLHPVLGDNCCDGQITVNYSSDDAETVPFGGLVQSGSQANENFAVGTTTVTYSLIDQYGNSNSCAFDVTVLDTENPIILDCSNTIYINLDAGECCQIVSFVDPPVSDNCEVVSISYDPPSGSNLCVGTTVVTVTIEDAAGNIDQCQFDVIVEGFEVTEFELVCNDEINISLNADCQAIITADMLLEGNIYGCYDEYEITISETPGGAPIVGSPIIGIEYVNTTLYATVCDPATGNCCTTTINIEDKLAPEIACPEDITIDCNGDPYDLVLTGEAVLLTCEEEYTISHSDALVDYGTCADPRAILTRTWTVVDQSGLSASCEQTITIIPFEFDQMVFPADLNGLNSLSCSDVAANPDLTTPEYSGVPTIGGQSVYGDHYCDIYVGYWDELLYDANCVQGYSILRHWVVQNGCEPLVDGINPRKHIQNIIVDDTEAPNLEAFDDVTISTDSWGCGATYNLPTAAVSDNCSPLEAVNVWYSSIGGVIIGNKLYISSPALSKTATVTVYAKDDCGNTSSESFTVTVQDLVPPTVVADDHTVAVLTTTGVAKLYAKDFDDGSYDGCGPIGFLAKRMDDGGDCGILDSYDNVLGNGLGGNLVDDNAEFNEVVHFCCADIQYDTDGNQIPIMVQFMVCDDGDQNGVIGSDLDNCNSVMIEVIVQDKLPPIIECPENVTINCIDYAALGDLSTLSDDELNAMFGEATVYSTCGGAPDQVLSGTEVCGSGVVNRIFTVTTAGGSATCIQKIFVQQDVNGDNFLECEDITFPSAPESSYNWCLSASNGGPIQSFNPIVVNGTGCGGFTPQAPSINIDDLCTEVGVNMTIDTFAFAGGGCFKYLVHWEVIDQCLFDENYVDPETGETNPYHTENGYFHIYVEYDVFDDEGPVLNCTEDVTIGCNEAAYAGPIVGSASDNCTEPAYFGWNWKLDVDNNFTIDAEGQGNAVPGPFPVGTHRIIWIVSDGCGNTTTENCVFSVEKEDNKAPTPYCFDGLSTAIMQPGACNVTLWAEDFNAGSFDDCGLDFVSIVPEIDVEGLSADEAYAASLNLINGVYGWTFDCSYIENGVTGEIEIRMYATDDAGNYDFCVASLRLDDNFDCCEDTGENKLISGEVYTEAGDGIADAMIEANTTNPEFPQYDFTDGDGAYGFENVPQYYDYELTAEKDVEYLNGVTTLDLVMIQKHILSLDPLDSPYQLIAADINGDCNITANDLLELRKLILGLFANNDLPNNQSWRFVDADYVFENPNNPCPFDEIINIDNLIADMMAENFIGVKIGDVNGTAVANANMDAETRNATALTLSVKDAMVAEGQEFAIEFTSATFNQVSGYQFTLGFNETEASFIRSEAGSLNVSEANFGLNRIDEGMITTSWGTVNPVTATAEDVLFTLHFKATADLNISEFITLNSRITPAESYQGVYLDVHEMNLEFRTENGVIEGAVFELYQNEPNPFDGESVIGFTLPEAGNATITIFDVTGKVVKVINGEYAKGLNNVTVNRNAFNTSGVLYYQLESGDYTATKKMIVLE